MSGRVAAISFAHQSRRLAPAPTSMVGIAGSARAGVASRSARSRAARRAAGARAPDPVMTPRNIEDEVRRDARRAGRRRGGGRRSPCCSSPNAIARPEEDDVGEQPLPSGCARPRAGRCSATRTCARRAGISITYSPRTTYGSGERDAAPACPRAGASRSGVRNASPNASVRDGARSIAIWEKAKDVASHPLSPPRTASRTAVGHPAPASSAVEERGARQADAAREACPPPPRRRGISASAKRGCSVHRLPRRAGLDVAARRAPRSGWRSRLMHAARPRLTVNTLSQLVCRPHGGLGHELETVEVRERVAGRQTRSLAAASDSVRQDMELTSSNPRKHVAHPIVVSQLGMFIRDPGIPCLGRPEADALSHDPAVAAGDEPPRRSS